MGRIKKVPKTNQISKIFDNKCERKPDNGSVLHQNDEPEGRDKNQSKRKYKPTNENAKAQEIKFDSYK